ncbi:MAG TPA: GNAT family N-acetyltransferase [Chloroflexia bacterium]|nr:GNAT family N-acetyltransferase [Chloroflexia bacterium]
MSVNVTLKPLESSDNLQAVVDLMNTHFIEPVTLEAWLRDQEQELAKGDILRQVLAVDANGRIAGYQEVKREYGTWDPGRLNLWLIVAPDARNQGIGTRLYEDGMSFVQERSANKLDTEVSDDDAVSLVFAERRGFYMDLHTYGFRLDVPAFDEAPFAGAVEAAEATGIRFFSMSDLGNTLDAQRKLYELNKYIDGEVPGERLFPSLAEFSELVFASGWYVPDGQIIAADGDRWVGMSAVGYFPDKDLMRVMVTGVDSDYRGRGIGLALKLLTHRVAKQYRVKHLVTGNASHNAPMLAINTKLGYTKLRGTYHLLKALGQ